MTRIINDDHTEVVKLHTKSKANTKFSITEPMLETKNRVVEQKTNKFHHQHTKSINSKRKPTKFFRIYSLLQFTDAAPEAVKRKAEEVVEGDAAVADETAPTAEKKSKVDEVATNGAEAEVVA